MGGRWGGALWIALWSAPLWSSVFGRVFRHKTPWLVDFNSVVCGAEHWAAHQPLYSANAACRGLPISALVYPPWAPAVFSYPVRRLGERAVLAGYAVVFAAALALLFWLIFRRSSERQDRAPFLAFTSGNLVFVGNIAVVAQAGIVAAAVFLGGESLACLAAIVAAALIKPIYLTFLAIPALAATGLVRRVVLPALAAGAVIALSLSNLPQVPEWRAFTVAVAVDPHPGGGLLGWLGQLGVSAHPVLAAVYLVYAALIAAAVLIIAERGGLDARQRVWLAASVAVLLLPRIMAYDLLLLGPGLIVASDAVRAVSPAVARRAVWLWLAACAINLVSSLVGGTLQIGHSIALALVAAGLVWLGVVVALNARRPAVVQGGELTP